MNIDDDDVLGVHMCTLSLHTLALLLSVCAYSYTAIVEIVLMFKICTPNQKLIFLLTFHDERTCGKYLICGLLRVWTQKGMLMYVVYNYAFLYNEIMFFDYYKD